MSRSLSARGLLLPARQVNVFVQWLTRRGLDVMVDMAVESMAGLRLCSTDIEAAHGDMFHFEPSL